MAATVPIGGDRMRIIEVAENDQLLFVLPDGTFPKEDADDRLRGLEKKAVVYLANLDTIIILRDSRVADVDDS